MGGACGMYGARRGMYRGVCWGIVQEGDHLEDLNVDERIISEWFLSKRDVRMYWIDVAVGVD
jgi:hypothetical protein